MTPSTPAGIVWLRQATLLGSTIIEYLRTDPRGFAGKVLQRMRESKWSTISGLGQNLAIPTVSSSDVERFIAVGEISRAVVELKKSVGSSKMRVRELENQLAELKKPAIQSPQGIAKPGIKGEAQHRALHLLTNSLPHTQSGYTVRSHRVLKAQQEAGIDCCAVTRLGYPILIGRFPRQSTEMIDGIKYVRLLPWFLPLDKKRRFIVAVNSVEKIARRYRATVIHTTTDFKNAQVAAEVAHRLRIPWVYEVRGELESTWLSKVDVVRQREAKESEFYSLARAQETAQMNAAARVVALSEIYREEIIERGVDKGKISVVPNAIDSADLDRDFNKNSLREELGLPNARLIGSITSVVDYEGLDVLVEAMRLLPKDIFLLIVGDGVERSNLEQQVERLKLTDRVLFAGRRPQHEIWKWYATLDVFVIPRKDKDVTRKVTPIKGLQAQALGVPVVASDLPALREVTGGSATYTQPEQPEKLAEAIQKVLTGNSPSVSRDWMLNRTWTANGQRYRRLYDGLRDGGEEDYSLL